MKTLPRRTILRGLGTAIALPWLEAMTPRTLRASTTAPRAATRLAFVYVPNGVHMPDWTPQSTGPNFELSPLLEPLQIGPRRCPDPGQSGARSGAVARRRRRRPCPGDGHLPDRHPPSKDRRRPTSARGSRSTSSPPDRSAKPPGSPRWRSVAKAVATPASATTVTAVRIRSTSPGEARRPRRPRRSTPGSSSIASSRAGSRAKLIPRQPRVASVGTGACSTSSAEDARRLRDRLGVADRRKLEEYLTGVREIERRIDSARPVIEVGQSTLARPVGIPSDYREHLRLMADLLVLAFRADLTRIATFVFANDGSNRSYRAIGVPEGHHDLSHHGRDVSEIRQDPSHQPIPRRAVRLPGRSAQGGPRRGRLGPRPFDDRLRQRDQRRQRPCP